MGHSNLILRREGKKGKRKTKKKLGKKKGAPCPTETKKL